ncbi:zinc-binding dehydrogenase [Streptomyces sp. B21-105]|uniref:zinc-binding dehydrogenase n=1 Tax=Streptomyces sp. B21-105 TaxID=3039417 RepID=UPI003FA77AAC
MVLYVHRAAHHPPAARTARPCVTDPRCRRVDAAPDESDTVTRAVLEAGGFVRSAKAICRMSAWPCSPSTHRDDPVVNLVAAPMTHTVGTLTLPCTARGGTVVVMSRPDPVQLLDLMEKHRVTELFLPPTVIYRLLEIQGIEQRDCSSPKYLMYGSAPMSTEKLRRAIEVFGPVMFQGSSALSCSRVTGRRRHRPRSPSCGPRSTSPTAGSPTTPGCRRQAAPLRWYAWRSEEALQKSDTSMTLMRAARLHLPTHTLTIEEAPRPTAGPGHVLIEVAAAGVCMSDVHLIDGTLGRPPHLQGDNVTVGHEVSGTIAELGDDVTQFTLGQRVVLQAVTPGVVRCIPAEWISTAVGPNTPWRASSPCSPCPTPFRSSRRRSSPTPCRPRGTPSHVPAPSGRAEAAGVWGVAGLGAHAVQLLRAVGVFPIIAVDPVAAARGRALDLGADVALDSGIQTFREQVLSVTKGRALNAAFDFAGVSTVHEQALTVLAPGGRLILAGLSGRPLVVNDSAMFSYLKQEVRGHFGTKLDAVPQLVELVGGGRLDFSRSITDVLPLEKASVAVERLRTKEGNPLRLILKP